MSEGEAVRPDSLPAGEPGRVLRLAFHRQHPEFEMLAREMQHLLQAQDIVLELIEQDYEEWAGGEESADLWLGTVNFPVPETWNAGAWLFSLPLLRHSVSGGDAERFTQWQHAWPFSPLAAEHGTALDPRNSQSLYAYSAFCAGDPSLLDPCRQSDAGLAA